MYEKSKAKICNKNLLLSTPLFWQTAHKSIPLWHLSIWVGYAQACTSPGVLFHQFCATLQFAYRHHYYHINGSAPLWNKLSFVAKISFCNTKYMMVETSGSKCVCQLKHCGKAIISSSYIWLLIFSLTRFVDETKHMHSLLTLGFFLITS